MSNYNNIADQYFYLDAYLKRVLEQFGSCSQADETISSKTFQVGSLRIEIEIRGCDDE